MSLLADGVFRSRAKAEHRAALLFADDASVVLMNHLLDTDAAVALATEGGAAALSAELRDRAAAEPAAAISSQRMCLAARIFRDRGIFDAWWQPRLHTAAGSELEAAWLRIGAPYDGGSRLPSATTSALAIASPSRFLTGGTITKDSDVLGDDADYGRLLQEIRFHHNRSDWWAQTHATFTDPLSRATWALALACAASSPIVEEHLALFLNRRLV